MQVRTSSPLLVASLFLLPACAEDDGLAVCGDLAPKVYGCVRPDPMPADASEPWPFVSPGTVTAVRPAGAVETCRTNNEQLYVIGRDSDLDVTMIDLEDAGGNMLTVGLAVPGFTPSAVAVGDILDVTHAIGSSGQEFTGPLPSIRVERDGQLLAAVGETSPVGFTVDDGALECRRDGSDCGTEHYEMKVEVPGGATASIPNGATVEVGALTVTNDHYINYYDTSGGCNFGGSAEYLIGVASTP